MPINQITKTFRLAVNLELLEPLGIWGPLGSCPSCLAPNKPLRIMNDYFTCGTASTVEYFKNMNKNEM